MSFFSFQAMSLKNKIFFSTLAVIMVISVIIALLARWILISGLSSELELRGVAVARSISERAGGHLLDKDYPALLSLLFEETRLRERQHMINYVFVTDRENAVLAHTFTRPFPDRLRHVNPIPVRAEKSVRLLRINSSPAYDIGVPVREGIYRIGSVHVGLNKTHIDSLVAKLRFMFLGFISAVIVIIFGISHRLAQYITSPVTKLIAISDELSKGNFDVPIHLGPQQGGWDMSDCPAFQDANVPCWHFDDQVPGRAQDGEMHHGPLGKCRECTFYRRRSGDEVIQLADSYINMVWSIRLYRRRLQESEGKYRSLFNSGPDPIFVVDCSDYTILDANPRSEELYNYSKKDLVGLFFPDLCPDSAREFMDMFDEKTGQDGCIYFPKILQYKRGRKPFYVNIHACPISYRGRRAVILAATDITEMMEKDAQLIQASKMKTLGEMSAGIAHELNQPLNAIKMSSEYLVMIAESGRRVGEEKLLDLFGDISVQVDRATEIINNLRAFGRKATLRREQIDINAPIRGVLSILGKQFMLQDIDFRLELGESLPLVVAHDNRLQQVFFNILTNARDAIRERQSKSGTEFSGMIRIRTTGGAGQVTVSISDNGSGIPFHVRDKIFEPFFTTKESGQGMGLGLAICMGIIKDYKGSVEIGDSSAGGTEFKIYFPGTESGPGRTVDDKGQQHGKDSGYR